MNHSDQAENPFLRWLDLDIADPSHFEVLRIDVADDNPKAIKFAAKSALSRIGEAPGKPDFDSWKLVQRRIRKAYNCLIDHQQRTEYIASLEARPEPAADIAARSADDDFEVASLEENDEQNTERTLDTVADELRGELQRAGKKENPRAESSGSIPTAIPMAEVIGEEPDTAALPTRPEEVGSPPPPLVNTDPPKKKYGRGRFRKKKSAMPLLLLLLAGAVTAGYFVVLKPRLDEGASSTGLASNGSGATANTASGENKNGNLKLPKTTARDDPQNRPSPDELKKRSNKPPTGKPKTPDATTKKVGTASPHDIDLSWARMGAPTMQDRMAIFHHLEEALLATKRRRWPDMERHLDAVKTYTMSRELLDIWYRQKLIGMDYQRFWNAVAVAGKEFDSMTQLELADSSGNNNVLVVTEARKDQLIYRLNGQRIASRYEDLPVLIAIRIYAVTRAPGLLSSVTNSGLAWCLAARFNPDYRDNAVALLDEANSFEIDDEQEIARINDYRLFLDDDLKSIYQPGKLKRIGVTKIRNRQKELAKYHNAMKANRRLPAGRKLAAVAELRDLAMRSDNELDFDAFIHQGIELAAKTNSPHLWMELINLKNRRAQHGAFPTNYLAQFDRLRKKKLSPEDARFVITLMLEHSERCVKLEENASATKCQNFARQLAAKYEFVDVVERIDRQYGEGNSRKSGRLGF